MANQWRGASIKQSSEFGGPPPVTMSMCDGCGQRPKNPGFDYCSKNCALNAPASAPKLTLKPVPVPVPVNPNGSASGAGAGGPAGGFGLGAGVGPQPTADDLCETCHSRPKHVDKTNQGSSVTFPYCGRACADMAKRNAPSQAVPQSAQLPAGDGADLCELCRSRPKREERDAQGRVTQHLYCGKACADRAKARAPQPAHNSNRNTQRGTHPSGPQARLCPTCRVKPVKPGYNHCSKACAMKP